MANSGSQSVSSLSVEDAAHHLGANVESGLSKEEASVRLQKYGKNALPKPKRFSVWVIFLRQFSSPLIWILMIGALIAAFLGEWVQMGAISAIVLINALVSLFQEYSAERSFEALQSLYVPESKVLRGGRTEETPSHEIVPGDIVLLEAGDQVPADGRIAYSAQLAIQEAALTGESAAVHKRTDPMQQAAIADQKNMAFSGTHVVSGKDKLIVSGTGLNTELGKIAESLRGRRVELTPLQIRFNQLGKQLIAICLSIIALIALLGFWKGMSAVQIALTSLSLAVAAVPEGLPAIVTITLAAGVRKMAKRNALIRRLASVETLGSTTVICSDKTGTLTKNEMDLEFLWIGSKTFEVTGAGLSPEGEFKAEGTPIDPKGEEALLWALKIGVLCNNSELLQNEKGEWEVAGDPTEGALLAAAGKAGLWKKDLEKEAAFAAEIPFDSDRKRMCYLRKDDQLYVKGALETVLPLCESLFWEKETIPLDNGKRQAVLDAQSDLASRGFRILALAHKEMKGAQSLDPSMETGLRLVGLAAMIDPPRPGVKEAVEACREAKMTPVMITGDHKQTAIAVAKETGLMQEGMIAIEGIELDQMDDAKLREDVQKTAVFARVSAQHKLRVIEALKSHGHIVAMTGDGVNDAPAIKKADIGISMGITGTEVTKQASDMVILDDHFATIVAAIKEGRGIYSNIVRFVRFLLSANFAEILVILFGILWGFAGAGGETWAILLPSQILWINLVTDDCPAIALAFDPIEKGAMKRPPRRLSEPILSFAWIIKLVLIRAVAAVGSIVAAHLGFLEDRSSGQSMAFTMLVIFEIGVLFLIRMPLSPLCNRWLLGAVLLSILLQLLVLYFPPMRIPFGTDPLSGLEWLQILGLALVIYLASFFVLRKRRG